MDASRLIQRHDPGLADDGEAERHYNELVTLARLRLFAALRPSDPDVDAALDECRARIEVLEQQAILTRPLPWQVMISALGLSEHERDALAVLLGVEVDREARRLMKQLLEDPAAVWADVSVLASTVYHGRRRGLLFEELAETGRLIHLRLVEYVGSVRQIEDAPLLMRPLRLSRRVLEAASGLLRIDPELAELVELLPVSSAPRADELLAPPALLAQLRSLIGTGLASVHRSPLILVSGPSGSGKTSLMRAAAAASGRGILRFDCVALPNDPREIGRLTRALVREGMLHRAIPLFRNLDVLGATGDRTAAVLRALRTAAGVVAVTAEPGVIESISGQLPSFVVEVPRLTEAQRARLWERQLGPGGATIAADAAARYTISGGVIVASATTAHARAVTRGEPLNLSDIHVGVRTTLDSKLATLGVRVDWRQTWADLVLPKEVLDEIREFIARVRHKRLVHDDWGFAGKVAKGLGLAALFSGAPGTGKTMVAGIIADQLGLDLYQIDLSRVVSKYVGDTEKNLASVFDAAEAGHAILLFDEADSLFARRTEVKSSVDRYANLEVNYLLQRMEAFAGITILTTNHDAAIDGAFRRRLALKVDFPIPELEERERLWHAMLPPQAQVADDLDFATLAERFDMSGGYIRNAVLRAAFMAAEDRSPIAMRHLLRAATFEYGAMGKLMHGRL